MAAVKKRKKKKKIKLSPEERKQKKIQSDHKSMVRSVFRFSGFSRAPKFADKEFNFQGQATDFDDYYTYENILICIEYTTSASSGLGTHLKTKNIGYEKIRKYPTVFVEFLCDLDPELKTNLLTNYTPAEVIVKVVYSSLNSISASHKENVTYPVYLDYAELRYFKNITDCVKKTALHELTQFLDIDPSKLGSGGKLSTSVLTHQCSGSLLPESNSNFDKGFKVVSFYVDPEALLKRAYVLRKDGWRDSFSMYQRMISKQKIEAIRKHLKKNKRVFVNNIIATLPDDTKILDEDNNTADPANISSTRPVTIQIPDRTNTIGLIDGQHRTFSYYEAAKDDVEIAKLRKKQNLLVTGIIYPKGLSSSDKEKFEARLFLEINSTQTNAKSNLKQSIGLVLEPFSAESIATRVIYALDESTGPLNNIVERYWFDQDKLKTTSIVSYALKPLVKTTGKDSLFYLWTNSKKSSLVEDEDTELLATYVKFCVSEINKILSAAKSNLPSNLWTTDKKIEGRIITTTNINALLICLRFVINAGKTKDFDGYNNSFKKLGKFDFKAYHSSQYNRMAEEMFKEYFSQ